VSGSESPPPTIIQLRAQLVELQWQAESVGRYAGAGALERCIAMVDWLIDQHPQLTERHA
jgi:hypothetical protein